MTRDLLLTEEPARRGFLRNLIAAPVAALATHKLILPAQAIVTTDDAAARLQHHLAGVEAAMRDLFPGAKVRGWGNCLNGEHKYYRSRLDHGAVACLGVDAALPRDREAR